ncbi:hypothetical protein STENM327S_00297 [Streptomyces tendae]
MARSQRNAEVTARCQPLEKGSSPLDLVFRSLSGLEHRRADENASSLPANQRNGSALHTEGIEDGRGRGWRCPAAQSRRASCLHHIARRTFFSRSRSSLRTGWRDSSGVPDRPSTRRADTLRGESASAHCGTSEEDADLAVLGPSGGAGVLTPPRGHRARPGSAGGGPDDLHRRLPGASPVADRSRRRHVAAGVQPLRESHYRQPPGGDAYEVAPSSGSAGVDESVIRIDTPCGRLAVPSTSPRSKNPAARSVRSSPATASQPGQRREIHGGSRSWRTGAGQTLACATARTAP